MFIAFAGIFFFTGNFPTGSQFFNMGIISPITAFAIIFVAYEGFQLFLQWLFIFPYHSLEQITEFASLVFIMADAAANYANLRLYKKTGSKWYISHAGLIGCVIAFPIVIYFLFTTKFFILLSIIGIFAIMLIIEFFYIERGHIEEEL